MRTLIVLRRAVRNAPISAPTLTTANSSVNVRRRAAEVTRREQREHGLEVVRQRADDAHHHERHPQLGHAAHVAQTLAHLTLGPRRRAATGAAPSVRIIQRPTMHRDVREPSSRKHQPNPTVATSSPASAGPTTRDDVISALFRLTALCMSSSRHHLDDERAAGRVVERDRHAADERDREDLPDLRVPAERERRQRERLHHRDRLHDQQQLALVGAVGDEPGPRAEDQHRAELRDRRARRARCRCR